MKSVADLNRAFEAHLNNWVFTLKYDDLTPDKRKERRTKADQDDLPFCLTYFPDIFYLPWNAAHRHLAQLKRGKHTVSGFRYSGKSAFVYIAKGIKSLCLGIGGIVNISCRTDEIADEHTAMLVRLIESNRLLRYDYEINIIQDKKGYYIINNTILLGTGANVGLRGYLSDQFKRFRVSINDDLYDSLSVKSQKNNDKIYDFVSSEVYGMLEDDGLSITLGNSITADCPIVRIKKLHPDNHFSLPAVDEKGESTWPEYRSAEEWAVFKSETPLDIWEGEYMDKPFEKGDIFDKDWLRSININTVKILAAISAADPAHGQSPAACDKGLFTIGATSSHEVVALDIYIRKEDYIQFFNYIHQLRQRIPAWRVLLFENDFNQWFMAQPYYIQWMAKSKATIPIVQFSAKALATDQRGADKDSRLLNLVHPHQTGMFAYSDRIMDPLGNFLTPDGQRYRAQYLSFGRATGKLDGLDAAATAYIMIFRYIETGSFKALKKKIFSGRGNFLR